PEASRRRGDVAGGAGLGKSEGRLWRNRGGVKWQVQLPLPRVVGLAWRTNDEARKERHLAHTGIGKERTEGLGVGAGLHGHVGLLWTQRRGEVPGHLAPRRRDRRHVLGYVRHVRPRAQ